MDYIQANVLRLELDDNILDEYLKKDLWTPVIGAQVLCGIKPLSEEKFESARIFIRCPEIDEASRILQLWVKEKKQKCAIPPDEFMAWAGNQNLNLEWLKSPERDSYLPSFDFEGKLMVEKFKGWRNPPKIFPLEKSTVDRISCANNTPPKKNENGGVKISRGKFYWVYKYVIDHIADDKSVTRSGDVWLKIVDLACNENPPRPFISYDKNKGVLCETVYGDKAYITNDNIRKHFKKIGI